MDGPTIEAAQAGNREALAAIVDDFMPTVLGAAYGLCGDWDVAGDIAQETFATLVDPHRRPPRSGGAARAG